MTVGAKRRRVDVFLKNSCSHKLPPVRFNQVEEDSRGEFAMARSAGGEKQQRIFLAHGIGVFDFAEESRSIIELRFEPGADFFSDLIATALDAGADGGFEIAGAGTEVAKHLSDAFFDDAFEGATPSSVEDADGSVFWIDEDDRQAVGGLNSQQ